MRKKVCDVCISLVNKSEVGAGLSEKKYKKIRLGSELIRLKWVKDVYMG